MYSIISILSFVLNFFVSAPNITEIMFISSLIHEHTKHLPALLVNPVFTPYTPYKFPKSSFVFPIKLLLAFIVILYFFDPTISLNFGIFSA